MSERVSASEMRAKIKALRAATGWTPSEIITLLRGGGSSGKGSDFERDLCRQFSTWWTDGARDDIFWRSSGSGARAKVRGRAGANTYGQHGDISATDPIGAPFIDAFTVELKRGYSEHTAQDLFDRLPGAGVQVWEGFVAQTIESSEQAGSLAWMMVTRRDRRSAMVWVPSFVLGELRTHGAFSQGYPHPLVRIRFTIRNYGNNLHRVDMSGLTLNDWFAEVKPQHVKELT